MEPSKANAGLLRISGLCGLLVPAFVLVGWYLAIASYEGFSWTSNVLSDLGVSQPSAVVFNTNLILAGALMMVFAIGVRELLPRTGLSFSGTSLLFLASLAVIANGVFTLESLLLHWIVAVMFFALAFGALIIIGLAEATDGERRGLIPLLLGALSMIVMGSIVFMFGGKLNALSQALTTGFFMAFTMLYGFRMLGEVGKTRISRRPHRGQGTRDPHGA